MTRIEVKAAAPERWDDVVTVFGKRGADPDWCWCRRIVGPLGDDDPPLSNRDALHREITTASVPPGVIAYVDGTPAGWSRIGRRAEMSAVAANRALRRVLQDEPGAWWIACFAVDRQFRNQGVASALVGAAVEHARGQGATSIEAHPVDTTALRADHVAGSALFTGAMSTFVAAGFVEVARTYPSRPVMRLLL